MRFQSVVDIGILQAIADDARTQTSNALKIFREVLSSGRANEERWGAAAVKLNDKRRDFLKKALREDDRRNDCEDLFLGLEVLRQIINASEAPSDFLQDMDAIIAIADSSQGAEIRFPEERAVFWLQNGSLNVGGGITAKLGGFGWIIAVGYAKARAPFKSPESVEDWFVNELRENAKRDARYKSLVRVEELSDQKLAGKKAVIVLLHGLFSTDVRTFDGFIDTWHAYLERDALDPVSGPFAETLWALKSEVLPVSSRTQLINCVKSLKDDVLIVGWPHSSLTGIEDNALNLANLLNAKIPENGPKVVFIAHSRGGLLGRRVAVELRNANSRWKNQLVGCVSFGTPHDGARIAMHPAARKVGLFFFLGSGLPIASALDKLLIYFEHHGGFQGLSDLAPTSWESADFLRELMALEQAGENRIKLYAVGGVCPDPMTYEDEWQQLVYEVGRPLVTRYVGGAKHDLAVRCESSAPPWLKEGNRLEVKSDHFSYFSDPNAPFLKDAMRRLFEWLGLRNLVVDCLKSRAGRQDPTIVQEEDGVWIGDTWLSYGSDEHD